MVQTKANDEYEQRLIDDVQRHGWHLIGVEDGRGPSFVYSVGLYHTLAQPEIIIFGLSDTTTMAQIVNVIGDEMRQGTKFQNWFESDQILEGYSCVFRNVSPDQYPDYLGYAMWFYRPKEFPVLQCVWPDKQGSYPWHPGVSAEFHERQPVLAQKEGWPFNEGKNRAVITTRPILEGTHPIMIVSHESDGDWQFLCGTTNRTEDGRVVCLHDVVEQHPAVVELADLPLGWQAVRASPEHPWQRQPIHA